MGRERERERGEREERERRERRESFSSLCLYCRVYAARPFPVLLSLHNAPHGAHFSAEALTRANVPAERRSQGWR